MMPHFLVEQEGNKRSEWEFMNGIYEIYFAL